MWETVIQVGGEGGSLTLKGLKLKDGTWLFTRIRDEGTLAEFLPSKDLETIHPILKGQSNIVAGLEQGLGLLNDSWPYLHARTVHPEFREIVWSIVSQADVSIYTLRHWAEVCFPDSEERNRRLEMLIV